MKIGLDERQKRLDLVGYSGKVTTYLQQFWPSGATLDVTVLVKGQRYFPDPDDGPLVELSFAIHVVSHHSPSEALRGAVSKATDAATPGGSVDQFLFVQVGDPIPMQPVPVRVRARARATAAGSPGQANLYVLASTYKGSDPPTQP